MSTATKLEYLNDTKQLLKENINNLGGSLTNEPFRQYASVLEGIYERLPKVSGIGASLSLSPSLMGKIKLNEIQGNTLQQNTPTPSSPVPIQSVTGLQNVGVCGKNLFDKSIITSGLTYTSTGTTTQLNNAFIQEIYIPVLSSTNYTISTTNNYSSTTDYRLQILEYDENKTFIRRNQGGSSSGNSYSITTGETTKYVRLGASTVTLDELQFEQGSKTTYEPYKGNTYEVNLGKNLLNVKDGSYSYGTTNTWVVQNHEVKMSVNDITYQGGCLRLVSGTTSRWIDGTDNHITSSGTYTLSVNKTGTLTFGSEGFLQFFVRLYNDDGTLASGTSLVIRDNQNKYTHTFTVDSGKHIGEVGIYSQYIQCQDVEFKIQLEKGSSSTSYSPYFTPIELNKIGDYEDSIKKSSGKNLFDYKYDNVKNVTRSTKSEETNGFKITSTGVSGFGYASLEIDNSLLGKTVTISMTSSGNKTPSGRLFNVNTSGNVTTAVSNFWTTNNSFTITLPSTLESGVKCIALCLYISQTNNSSGDYAIFKNIMIEENSQTTDYEPYGKVWYITKNIGKVVFDGSENWTNFTTVAGSSNTMSQIDLPMQFLNRDGYTDRFPVIPDYSATEHFVIAGGLTHLYVHILNSRLSTLDVAGFKSWLASNITTFYYVLKTPIYEVITNTELINQLESLNNAKSEDGTTNINVTSEDLSMLLNVGVIKGDA